MPSREGAGYAARVDWSPELRAALSNLGALKRCLRSAVADAYGELGIGEAQLKILRCVAASPGITQAELARSTETDPALTGRALRGLIASRVLRRKPSKEDGRAYVLELGPQGAALLERANAANKRLVERVSAPLDARDLADFDRIAKKLVATLDAPPAVTAPKRGSAPKRAKKR